MTTTTIPARQSTRRWRYVGGVAGITGPGLFTGVFLAQQWARRADYNWVAEPVSNLEAGPYGWIQQVNFVVFAILMALFAAGMSRDLHRHRLGWLGPALLGCSSVGLLLAAVFPIEQDASGVAYDPGGHFISGVTFFACSALALLALSHTMRSDPRWRGPATYVLASGLVALAGFVVLGRFAVPDEAPLHAYAGLAQRLLLGLVTFPCVVAIAMRLRQAGLNRGAG